MQGSDTHMAQLQVGRQIQDLQEGEALSEAGCRRGTRHKHGEEPLQFLQLCQTAVPQTEMTKAAWQLDILATVQAVALKGKGTEESKGLQSIWREEQTQATGSMMLKNKVLQQAQSLKGLWCDLQGAQLQPQKPQ